MQVFNNFQEMQAGATVGGQSQMSVFNEQIPVQKVGDFPIVQDSATGKFHLIDTRFDTILHDKSWDTLDEAVSEAKYWTQAETEKNLQRYVDEEAAQSSRDFADWVERTPDRGKPLW